MAVSEILHEYEVLPASGGWVDGQRALIGSTVLLYPTEAEYEVAAGFLKHKGAANVTPAPVLTLTDTFAITRDGIARPVTVADLAVLLAPLIGSGGAPEIMSSNLDFTQPLDVHTIPVT